MPHASPLAQLVFLLLVALVAFFWLQGNRSATPRSEAPTMAKRWMNSAILLLFIWLGVPAALAMSGWLRDFNSRPPHLLLMIVPIAVATSWLAYSAYGTRLVENISIGWLIGFQFFRLPLEWLLHRLHQENVIPVQMTYAGRNFDIITGILALLLLLWSHNAKLPRWTVWIFNLIGFALLINIVTIAILSAPVPFRRFFNEPANTFIAYWPWVWLPTFLVQAALFGHLLVFRWLRRN